MDRELIDLGTRPVGSTLDIITLDDDRLDYLVSTLTIADMPIVLGVFPRYDSQRSATDAIERGRRGLAADGLLPNGLVHSDLEHRLRVLEQPQWYIEVRRYPAGPGAERSLLTRACFATDGRASVIARRAGDVVTIDNATGSPAHHLGPLVTPTGGLPNLNANAPTDLLSEILDASHSDPASTADHLAHIGIATHHARAIAEAMASCHSITELGAVTRRHGQRVTAQHPVAVFDTPRGGTLATSSAAQDGRLWTTLAGFSSPALRRAVETLADQAERNLVS